MVNKQLEKNGMDCRHEILCFCHLTLYNQASYLYIYYIYVLYILVVYPSYGLKG